MPGSDYVIGFLERHRTVLTTRTIANYSRKRASVTSDVLNSYFDNLSMTIPCNIYNFDETNLTDNPGKMKCIVKRGSKYPSKVVNETKSTISLMVGGSASGQLLPPYVCYKSKNLYSTWRSDGPRGRRYTRSKSVWFDGEVFEDCFFSLCLPALRKKVGPKVHIGDNLSSHMSLKVKRAFNNNDIRFVCLPPPNATDYL